MEDQVVNQVEETTIETPIEQSQVDQQTVERRAEELYQARNFKMLREQAEAVARENQELKRRLESQVKPDKRTNPNDDDLIDGKLYNYQQEYIDRKLKEVDTKIQQNQMIMTENLIRSQCPDFDNVVTEENLAKLTKQHPEIAATINSSQDFKSKAISAYKLIKKLDIYNTQTNRDKELIAQNSAKPKPSNALPKTESDLSRANAFATGMTDAEKEARYKQALEWSRG